MVRGPIRYGTRYSATRQFFSATACTALHLLHRGFCSLVLFIKKVKGQVMGLTHIHCFFILRVNKAKVCAFDFAIGRACITGAR